MKLISLYVRHSVCYSVCVEAMGLLFIIQLSTKNGRSQFGEIVESLLEFSIFNHFPVFDCLNSLKNPPSMAEWYFFFDPITVMIS